MLNADQEVARPLKVSELVAILKRDIEQQHRFVRVIGEISSWKEWRSGHCYFDIKDEGALIPAVMFKPHFARVPFKVSDGMEVIFSGKVSVYQANARLQMIVEAMEPLGAGALALAFEQLKEKLLAAGLFLPAHKKPIKTINHTIGIVTSSHGAVLRDMVRIIKSRLPGANILCAFARVQGAGAKEEIVRAIERLDKSACDVMIVGRGGGSLEDLWAFNEEIVARAIFAAKTPIISAVGHETDTTISDFVADMRAATPSHAAQIVTPLLSALEAEMVQLIFALTSRQNAFFSRCRLALFEHKKLIKDPKVILFRHWQLLDEHSQRLQNLAPHRLLRLRQEHLHGLKNQLLSKSPRHELVAFRLSLNTIEQKLPEAVKLQFKNKRQTMMQHIIKLEALSPLKVLARGFSLVEDRDSGRCLTKARETIPQQNINIRFQDGLVAALIIAKE
jgi:exodeoxyribonuclease VII large subunit